MSLVNRDLDRTLIVDNSPTVFRHHPDNGIEISSWEGHFSLGFGYHKRFLNVDDFALINLLFWLECKYGLRTLMKGLFLLAKYPFRHFRQNIQSIQNINFCRSCWAAAKRHWFHAKPSSKHRRPDTYGMLEIKKKRKMKRFFQKNNSLRFYLR